MRELTKALGSFSVAISTFGAQQLLNLARRPLPGRDHPTTDGLDAVSAAAEQQLDGTLRQAFEAGDGIQRGAVDLVWGVLTLQTLNPSKVLSQSTDLLRQSTRALGKLIPRSRGAASGGTEKPAQPSEPCGWGPMP